MNTPSLRMYVDENGNNSLHDDLSKDDNRYLCLSGVAMRLSEHNILEEKLNTLKLNIFGTTDIVLHRREIIPGKPPFEVLKSESVRKRFDDCLLQIIIDINYRVFSIVIDKKALVEKYGLFDTRDPYVIALEFLMQRYQYWMQRFDIPIMGDILAEARGGREDKITKEAYKYVYEGKGFVKLRNTKDYFSSKEIKLKKKKDNIAGLQLVEILTHPSRRYILIQNIPTHNIIPNSYEQKIVDVLVKYKFSRIDDKISGVGAVFFPK